MNVALNIAAEIKKIETWKFTEAVSWSIPVSKFILGLCWLFPEELLILWNKEGNF